jgi:predicted transporter
MIGDYLRIFYIENFEERFFGLVRKAFRFVLTNFFKTLGLYYLLSFILVLAILLYFGMDKVMQGIPKTSFSILLIFLVQQISSLFRAFWRLVYYSSQIALVDKLSAEEESLL